MPLSRKQKNLASTYRKWRKTKERAKELYDKADRILNELAASGKIKPGQPVKILESPGKNHVVLVNNYEGKDIVWGHGAVRRWDLELMDVD